MNELLEDYAGDGPAALNFNRADSQDKTLNLYEKWGKRGLDIALVLLALPLWLPLVLIGAGLVAAEGGAPFFWQHRVGRGGAPFWMLKLRSMHPDAERILTSVLAACPDKALEWETSQKLRRDPRVTKIGTLLRKTSVDELPQLWNVLTGDMSLVGPRPMMPSQSPLYPGHAYYRLRPGLTGPWQVFARNHRQFTARATYDAFYEQNVRLGHDLLLIKQTWRVLFRGTGQ